MAFNQYYQDELSFLRELGREFATADPTAAPFLIEPGADPDVERLLEGVAFLTGRIREKLDDEFPELTHSLMNLLWPHYLRPIPAASIVEFIPAEGRLLERHTVSRGTELLSVPIEGLQCRFRTCFEVDLWPVKITEAALETLSNGHSSLRIRVVPHGRTPMPRLNFDSMRLYLSGELSHELYFWLLRHLSEVVFHGLNKAGTGLTARLSPDKLRPFGFLKQDALVPVPSNVFDGYRLLQEYFMFPEKFLFLELSDLPSMAEVQAVEGFEVRFVFRKHMPSTWKIGADSVRLGCTPVVNLFTSDSEPIRVDHNRTDYRLRASGAGSSNADEIYSVDRAFGRVQGTSEKKEIEPFYSFRHGFSASTSNRIFFQTHTRMAVVGGGSETHVSFVTSKQTSIIPPTEIVSFNLTCTNRDAPAKLRIGDISVPTDKSPDLASFRNISRVSPSIRPALEGDIHWRLISHLSLNYLSLNNATAFTSLLGLYNVQSSSDAQIGRANDRRIQGVSSLELAAEDLVITETLDQGKRNLRSYGAVIRGTGITLSLKEDHFHNEGDMYLFASILNEFLALYASMNSFTRMTVVSIPKGDEYHWSARLGTQILL